MKKFLTVVLEGEIIGAEGTSGDYLGSGVYLVSQELNISSSGKDVDENHAVQLKTFYPSARTWTYAAPSNWVPVLIDAFTDIGANISVSARRGTSGTPWTTFLQANVFSN